jgi:RNA polymerase sigma factor (sigma-70 family)
MAETDFLGDIWQHILTGDSASWRRLVESLAPLVFTAALRMGLDQRDAEDCAQQTWLDLYQSRHSVDHPKSLPAWLIRVASRKASRMIHKRVREGDIKYIADPPADPILPDEMLVELESIARLRLALEQLDGRCQRLVHEVFFAKRDKSYADIARDLKIPVNSLGPTRSRCLAKLRRIMVSLE